MPSLLLLGLLLATNPDEPTSQAEVRDLCSAQVAFGDCLASYASKSATMLLEAEKRAAARIEQWDEDAPHRSQAKAALTRSSAEFLRYRSVECEFAASLAGDSIGTAHDHWRLACFCEQNVRRARSLDGLVGELVKRDG